MSKIKLFVAIRRDLGAEMSGRVIEERYRVGRRWAASCRVRGGRVLAEELLDLVPAAFQLVP